MLVPRNDRRPLTTTPVQALAKLQELGAGVLDILAPQTCAESGLPSELALDEAALANLPRLGQPRCQRCQGPAIAPAPECRACQNGAIAYYAACAPYSGWWRERIRQLKFKPEPALIAPMAKVMAELLLSLEPSPTAILVPIPPSNRDSILKGGAITLPLCHALQRQTGLPVACQLLYRHRPSQTQRQRNKQERAQLSPDLFGVDKNRLPTDTTSIILIDDVMTTGATLKAAAQALQQTYPGLQIEAAILARAQAPTKSNSSNENPE